jgi:hypothetical protein
VLQQFVNTAFAVWNYPSFHAILSLHVAMKIPGVNSIADDSFSRNHANSQILWLKGAKMRHKCSLLVLALLFGPGVAISAAQDNSDAKRAAQTWSTFFQRFGDYDPNFFNNSDVVNFFTPATDITVSRMEVKTAFGPTNSVSTPSFCTKNPGVEITDGTTSHTLTLSNPSRSDGKGGSTTDSGPLSVNLAAGSMVSLIAIHGEPELPFLVDACFTNSINVTVQYESRKGEGTD